MTPKQLEHDQGRALSSPKRDIFPFMSLPAEIRIQIYKIDTPDCICVPSWYHPRYMHCLGCARCFSQRTKIKPLIPFPPHIKALLQIKQIRDDMLPHLHLAWVGGITPPMVRSWRSFKQSAIPAVSNLTIGIRRLFRRSKLCLDPGELLRWMQWRSQQTSRYQWNLRHLTLLEGSRHWPANPASPVGIMDISYERGYPNAKKEESPETAEAMAKGFPMIKGLRTLRLRLMAQPCPVFLDRLSKRCEAHGIDLTVTVQET